MLALVLPLCARAATFTEADAQALVAELAPRIEQAAGRTFVERPKIGIARQGVVAGRLQRLRGGGAGSGEEVRRLDDVLGLYLFGTQEIFLLSDNLERLFGKAHFGPALLAPITRCVVAHELVHALQHQRASRSDGPVEDVARAVLEGHADHVAAQVCGDGVAWLDRVQGLDVPASRPATDPLAFDYGYAETFVRTLEAVAGREAVWSLLDGPPPPRELIVRVGTAGLPAGWRDPTILAPIGRAAGAHPDAAIEAGVVTPWGTLAPLDPDAGALVGVGGLGWSTQVGVQGVRVVAFLLRDEGAARSFLSARRAAPRGSRFATLAESGVFTWSGMWFPWRTRRVPGVSGTAGLRMRLGSDVPYFEGWATRGRLLFGLAASGDRTRAWKVDRALAALVALDLPVDAAPRALAEEDRLALVGVGAIPPAPDAVAWSWRADQLSPAITRGDWGGCAAHVEAHVEEVAGPRRDHLVEAGLRCAVNARDLAVADRLYGRLVAPQATAEDVRIVLAGLLLEASRAADVLRVLPTDGTGHSRGVVDGLRLDANLRLRRFDEVERIVRLGAAPADLRAFAGVELGRVGRRNAARRALAEACPALEGDARRVCQEAAARLGR